MGKRKQRILCFLVLAAIGLSPGLFPADVEVTARVSADKIGTDDVLIYTVTVKGIDRPTQPQLSHFNDFRVAQTSRGTEIRFINGVTSYFTNFQFYLVPLKTGKLTLPPVKYRHEGQEYKTQPFTVEAVKGRVAPPPQSRRRRLPSIFDDDDFFSSSPFKRSQPREIDVKVLAVASKRKVMKGEQVIFKILLYTQNRVQSVNMISNQSIPGFWQEWFPVSRSIEGNNRTIDGKVYQVFEIRKAALFPTKAGAVTIPSLEFDLVLADNAFSVFSNARPIRRSTRELTIDVSEPPPQGAGLPVGHFTMDVRANKKEIDINDILTLKIKIAGRGNVKTLDIPEFKSSDYFKVYPAKITRDVNFRENGMVGSVEAEVPVSFKKTGLISFPPLAFKYLNPDTAAVVPLESQALMINVTGIKDKQETAVTVGNTEIIKTGEDIDFIKKGNISNREGKYYKSRVFTLLLLVPFLLNLLFILKVFVFDRYISQSALLKKRKLLNRTIKSLESARDHGEISPVLENYLKEKTGLGLSEINNQSIDHLLSKYNVHDVDIKTFIRLKSESESSRFSPGNMVENKSTSTRRKKLKNDLKVLMEILKRIDGKIK